MKLASPSLALAAIMFSAQSHATLEPLIRFNIQHYAVEGMTTNQISRSIHSSTPEVLPTGRFAGMTRNGFTVSYNTVPSVNGGCVVMNAMVELDSTVTLPRLTPAGQSLAVQKEWNRYIGALRAHEMMHAQNGKRTAQTVAERLYQVKSDMPCALMRKKLDQAVETLIQNMARWDENLDQRTNHGDTQGAYLRPGVK